MFKQFSKSLKSWLKKKKKKENMKAFTLIELLSTLIVVGLLIAIAIPNITKYLDQSRKKTYIATVNSYTDGIARMIANGEINGFYDEGTIYSVPHNCVNIEGKTNNQSDDQWDFLYLLVSVEKGNFKYYVYSKDKNGIAIDGKEVDKLKISDLKTSDINKEDNFIIEGKMLKSIVS